VVNGTALITKPGAPSREKEVLPFVYRFYSFENQYYTNWFITLHYNFWCVFLQSIRMKTFIQKELGIPIVEISDETATIEGGDVVFTGNNGPRRVNNFLKIDKSFIIFIFI